MPTTKTLQSTVNFCSTHADLLPLAGVGGYTNEPALTLCNDAVSDIITDPNDFVFNRVEMPSLFTCPNKQDYLFAGASAFCLQVNPSNNTQNAFLSQGWAIDLASNNAVTVSAGVVTVNTLEAHRLSVGATVYLTGLIFPTTGTAADYNSTFTDNGTVSQWNTGWVITATTTKSFSFAATSGQNNSDVGGAPGITNFGYATSASMQEVNNNSSPPNVWPLSVKRELVVSSRIATPEKVSVMVDLGTGVLKLRLLWVPSSTIYAVNIVYQAAAPTYTTLSATWAPFPDNFSAVYQQALLYRMYRYINSPTADNEYKKLQAEIAKVQAADDATQTDVNLQADTLMDSSYDGMAGWW
jgi:hypothetical protein